MALISLADPTGSGYDIAATARSYAAMAGVLAGFAFVAITNLLSSRRQAPGRSADNVDHGLTVLLSAFAGLVISTLLNALIAGEAVSSGRAAIEEIIAGAVLAISTLMLFYGIQLLLHDQGLETVSKMCRTLVVAVGPSLAALFITVGAGDVEVTRVGSPDEVRGPVVVIEVILTLGLILYCVFRWLRPAESESADPDYSDWLPRASLMLFVVLGGTFALITQFADQGFHVPTQVVIPSQLAVFVFIGMFVRRVSRRPRATPPAGDEAHGQLAGVIRE